MSAELPGRSDRVMLYALAVEWDLPAWFDRLDAVPSKSPLDAWRWAWREYGSGVFSVRGVGKDLAWTISSYARATDGVDGRGRRWVAGEAGASLETMAGHMGVDRRTLTRAIQRGEEAGWWLYLAGNRNRPTRVFLSLPKKEPARPAAIVRPDRRAKQPRVINGIEAPLINGAEPRDNAQRARDQWHKPEESPKPECESETIETSSVLASPACEAGQEDDRDHTGNVLIRFKGSEWPARSVRRQVAAECVRSGAAEVVSPPVADTEAGAA